MLLNAEKTAASHNMANVIQPSVVAPLKWCASDIRRNLNNLSKTQRPRSFRQPDISPTCHFPNLHEYILLRRKKHI